MRISH